MVLKSCDVYNRNFCIGLNMLATSAMNLPLVIFVATCMLLCEHFRNISAQLQTCVQNEEIVIMEFEQLRTQHQYMTNTLTKADKIFSGLLLLTFTANLPLSCLSIYSLTKETETLPIISLVVWLVVGLMNVAIVSWFAGNVVEQVSQLDQFFRPAYFDLFVFLISIWLIFFVCENLYYSLREL